MKVSNTTPLITLEEMTRLADRLSGLPEVNRYNDKEHLEAETLVLAFRDIEEISHSLLTDLIPKLTNKNLTDEELNDLLIDIQMEFRHLYYHINAPRSITYAPMEE